MGQSQEAQEIQNKKARYDIAFGFSVAVISTLVFISTQLNKPKPNGTNKNHRHIETEIKTAEIITELIGFKEQLKDIKFNVSYLVRQSRGEGQ